MGCEDDGRSALSPGGVPGLSSVGAVFIQTPHEAPLHSPFPSEPGEHWASGFKDLVCLLIETR